MDTSMGTGPEQVRVLTGRETRWTKRRQVPGGLHNAAIASAAGEEMLRETVLRLVRCNAGTGSLNGPVQRPRDWNASELFDEEGFVLPVPASDVRLLVEVCLAVLSDAPYADRALAALRPALDAPFVEPYAIRGSDNSPAARHLTGFVAVCCGQAADLLGAVALLERARGNDRRARDLVDAGDRILAAPMLVRYATGTVDRAVDTGVRNSSTVDDAALLLGVVTSGVDGMGRARPTNSSDRAEALAAYTVALMGGLAAGLNGGDAPEGDATGTVDSFTVRSRDAAAFGAALRELRDPDRDLADRAAVDALVEATERTVGIDSAVTLLLRHSPAATRRLEHQVLRGFSRYVGPPGANRGNGPHRRIA